MLKFFNSPKVTRIVTIIFSGLAILTTAQACSIPGLTPSSQSAPVLGVLKKGDPRSTSENFIRAGAVKQLNGKVASEGLKDVSGLKLIQSNSDVLYLLTQQRGLFKTEDGGYTWERKYIFKIGSSKTDQKARDAEIATQITRNNKIVPTDLAVNSKDNKIIYVAAKDGNVGKVYQSTDGGENFRQVYTEVQNNIGVTFISIDPINTNRVYGVLQGGSLIRSLDGGVTWQKIRSFKETPIQIGFVPEFGNLMYLLFPTESLAISTDDGESFTTREFTKEPSSIGENQPKDGLDLTFRGPTNFGKFEKILPVLTSQTESWVLFADRQIWYSENRNTVMTKMVLPLQSEKQNLIDVAVDPKQGLKKVYISINDKLFETNNRGESWKTSNQITTKIGNIGQILIDPKDTNIVYLMLISTKSSRNNGLFSQ